MVLRHSIGRWILFSWPFHQELSQDFWDPERHDIQQTAELLILSPLFAEIPLTVDMLEPAIDGLGLLFCPPHRLEKQPSITKDGAQQSISQTGRLNIEDRSLKGRFLASLRKWSNISP